MDAERAAVPDDFLRLVRDALLHLYDTTYLQTHPLVGYHDRDVPGPTAAGKVLCQSLLDAIGALHPSPGASATSPGLRSFRILELRYISGLEAAEVVKTVCLSKRQYHREHHKALEAVASHLWASWRMEERWPRLDGDAAGRASPGSADDAVMRYEAEQLAACEDSDFDPLEVAQGVADLLHPVCAQAEVELHVEGEPLGARARGDRVALRQALLTLIGQLVDEVGAASDDAAIAMSIGPDDPATSYLGLEITSSTPVSAGLIRTAVDESRPFVDALQADVEASLPGCGSNGWRIALSIPIVRRQVLLVVDNNPDFIALVKRFLAGSEWDVVGAGAVDAALETARRQRVEVVLLDVVIPGQDGWDLLARLKADPDLERIPVVICSILHESRMATALGASAYLQKPVDQGRLLGTLRSLSLGRRVGVS